MSSSTNLNTDYVKNDPPSLKRESGKRRNFAEKLMDILNNAENEEIISWLPHGNGFIIHKRQSFASEILPKHYKATKFTSFTRKLNRWGFARVSRGPEAGSYYHRLFQRDRPQLVDNMSSNSGNQYHVNPLQQTILPFPGFWGPPPAQHQPPALTPLAPYPTIYHQQPLTIEQGMMLRHDDVEDDDLDPLHPHHRSDVV